MVQKETVTLTITQTIKTTVKIERAEATKNTAAAPTTTVNVVTDKGNT